MISHDTLARILTAITGGAHICPACRCRVTNDDGRPPSFRLDYLCRKDPSPSDAAARWSVIAWLCGVPS